MNWIWESRQAERCFEQWGIFNALNYPDILKRSFYFMSKVSLNNILSISLCFYVQAYMQE
jgi:hypothetical protein